MDHWGMNNLRSIGSSGYRDHMIISSNGVFLAWSEMEENPILFLSCNTMLGKQACNDGKRWVWLFLQGGAFASILCSVNCESINSNVYRRVIWSTMCLGDTDRQADTQRGEDRQSLSFPALLCEDNVTEKKERKNKWFSYFAYVEFNLWFNNNQLIIWLMSGLQKECLQPFKQRFGCIIRKI